MAKKEQATRIYTVRDKHNNIIALVDAVSAAGARSHVAKSSFDISLSSQRDLIEATKSGVEVQAAGEDKAAMQDMQQSITGA